MVIPGIPRAPKNHYRPTPPSYDDRADNEVLAHDLALSPDPYLHPSYAKAFRRPASPIQDGTFDPRVHATSVRRSRSASRRASSSSGHSRSRSVSAVAPPPPVQEPTPRDRKRYDSSGSKTSSSKQPPVHERSRASPASYASSGPPTAPPSPTDRRVFAPVIPVLPAISHEPDVYDHDEVDPIAAILQGSTRPGNAKPAKLRKSDKSLSSSRREGQGIGGLPSPVQPSPVKSRSAFSRFRFGRSAAGRGPPPQEPVRGAMLPPERRPSERDVGEPSGGLLSPASSFVILDGPPSPPHTPVGVSMYEDEDDQPRNRYDGTLVSRHDPVSGRSAEGGHLSQTAAAKAAQAKADLDQVDELDETDPSGFAWHTSGPYDVVSAIGSQVGSQVGSGSIVGTKERYVRSNTFFALIQVLITSRPARHRLAVQVYGTIAGTLTVPSILKPDFRLRHHIHRGWTSFQRHFQPARPESTRMPLTLVMDLRARTDLLATTVAPLLLAVLTVAIAIISTNNLHHTPTRSTTNTRRMIIKMTFMPANNLVSSSLQKSVITVSGTMGTIASMTTFNIIVGHAMKS
jgi:hypothetical protein